MLMIQRLIITVTLLTSLIVNGQEQEIKISNSGAVFVRDYSNPSLGKAYRDPSGTIWGSVVKGLPPFDHVFRGHTRILFENGLNGMLFPTAVEYCESIGARTAAMADFEQLRKYLGYKTEQGYSPFDVKSKTEIIEGLTADTGTWLWAVELAEGTTVDMPEHARRYYIHIYDGQTGWDGKYRLEKMSSYTRPYKPVICVSKK